MKKHYFPHDDSARNDQKILELRAEFGMEGYGIYWCLLESMVESTDGYLDRDAIGGLSLSYGVPKELLNKLITFCIDIGLFESENGSFFSQRMVEHKNFRKSLSDAGKEGAKKRWGDSPPNSPPNANNNKGKETKVNKTTVVDKKLKSWLKNSGKGDGYVHWLLKEYGEVVNTAWKKVLAGHNVHSPADFVELCKTLSSS